MEWYRAVKRIESIPPEELALFLSKFDFLQYSTMIVEERINGERLLNITQETMDRYLNKHHQIVLQLICTSIVENPIDFLKKYYDCFLYEECEVESLKSQDEQAVLGCEDTQEEDGSCEFWNAANIEIILKTGDRLLRGEGEDCGLKKTKPVKSASPINFSSINKYGELAKHEQFFNVGHGEGLKILKNQQTGAYIIRPSRSENCFCTLMIKTETDIVNVQVAINDGKYHLYSADNYSDICFEDMSSLLTHFKFNTMPLSVPGVLLCDNKSKSQKGTFFLA